MAVMSQQKQQEELLTNEKTGTAAASVPISGESRILIQIKNEVNACACCYTVYDHQDRVIGYVRPGEILVAQVPDESVNYYIRVKGYLVGEKVLTCTPNMLNCFIITPGAVSTDFTVSRIKAPDL